jgi:hypothetical protein
LGRYHTLHSTGGAAAEPHAWEEKHYWDFRSGTRLGKRWDTCRRDEQRFKGFLRRLSYRPHLEKALLRYNQALDGIDYERSYLQLWGVLEALTGFNRSYDDTIRRTLFLFRDRGIGKLYLEHLRQRRNDFVHAGQSSAEAEQLVRQLDRYVQELARFHLSRGPEFANFGEVCQFLDLPTDVTELQNQISQRRRAIRFRS